MKSGALGVWCWALMGWTGILQAQTTNRSLQVFPNDRLNRLEMLCHIEGGVLRTGADWRGEVLFTLGPSGAIYQGLSRSDLDRPYTVRDNQLVRGQSSFSDDILYTWDNDQVFIGDSRFRLDLVYNLQPVVFQPDVWALYPEDESSPSERRAVFLGHPTPQQLFAVLLALGLI